MHLRSATAADFHAILRLLEQATLNGKDLRVDQTHAFHLLCEGHETIACGAIEDHGSESGLVRSIAVHPSQRGKGHATQIMRSLEAHARQRGTVKLFLLTESATGFFRRLRYEPCDRSLAPASIQASPQFAGLCPSTAVCMRKDLREDA